MLRARRWAAAAHARGRAARETELQGVPRWCVDWLVVDSGARAALMRPLCPLLVGCLYWRTAGAQCKYQNVDFSPLNKATVSFMIMPAACEAPLTV